MVHILKHIDTWLIHTETHRHVVHAPNHTGVIHTLKHTDTWFTY